MVDGAQISELGVPSETRDGRVLFGVEIEEHGPRNGWEIRIADPNAPAAGWVSYALDSDDAFGRMHPGIQSGSLSGPSPARQRMPLRF